MLTDLDPDTLKLIVFFASLPLVVYLTWHMTTWAIQEVDASWQPPTPRSVWRWIQSQRVRVRVQAQPRGRMLMQQPPQVKVYRLTERAPKGFRRERVH